MKQFRTSKFSLLLALIVAISLLNQACMREGYLFKAPSAPVVVDHMALTSHKLLELRIGERMTIAGYTQDSIKVEDDDILQLTAYPQEETDRTFAGTTYEAILPGQTEVTITHTMCEGVTGCSGPALYYRLQIHVR